MHDSFDLVKAFVALLAIVNPAGNAALFLSLTGDDTPAERSRVAAVAAIAIATTLVVCVVAGDQILALFGIRMDDLRVAGGLVVLMIGLSMLHAQQSAVHAGPAETREGAQKESPAVVPLAIPIVAGPGAMATAIVATDAATRWSEKLQLIGATLAASALVYAAFRAAPLLQRRLGTSGMNIVVRIMGLLLAAIAIDMMAAGLRGEFPALAAGS